MQRKNYLNYTNKFGVKIISCVGTTGKKYKNSPLWSAVCPFCASVFHIPSCRINKMEHCGCMWRLRAGLAKRTYGKVTVTSEYHAHKNNGKGGGLGFLSKEDWTKIVFSPCYYCGQTDRRNGALNKHYANRATLTDEVINKSYVNMNGIDRIDSDKGYFPENCVPCCAMCNRMKNQFTQKDFLDKVNLIYQTFNKTTGI